jgi:hypothetical protein
MWENIVAPKSASLSPLTIANRGRYLARSPVSAGSPDHSEGSERNAKGVGVYLGKVHLPEEWSTVPRKAVLLKNLHHQIG